jgi:Uma2 family endonuclease
MTPVTAPPDLPPLPASRKGQPTWGVAYLYPYQGEWSEEAYLSLASSGRMMELSDGCLEFLPMPSMLHQRIVNFLHRLLEAFVLANVQGEVFFAPLPVRLWAGKYREPDVVYLRPERIGIPRSQPRGADLAIEIVSEGEEARDHDFVTKREEYAEAGIAEYWIVDPQEQRITVLTLAGPSYRVHGEFEPGSQATSVLLSGFAVAVDAVFAAGQGRG